jgi:hypothetical protein
MRDLLDRPESEWMLERSKIGQTGWGKRFLEQQDPEGTWGQGIYSPKWTSTTYTLLTLIDFGLLPETESAKLGAERILQSIGNLLAIDQCVLGFYLHILAYFETDEKMSTQIVEHLLARQMPDGGWNCRIDRVKNVRHSSFHTTFNVLEGLHVAASKGILVQRRFADSQAAAIEFMLQHRMYKSDRTGEIVNEHFTEFSYPPRWHYDVLRGLDYMRQTSFREDPRLQDPIDLLNSRAKDGIWPAQNKHAGKEFFPLESPPRLSRWNTLRALRVLKTIKPLK